MPLVQVTGPQESLARAERDELMTRLSDAVLTAERAPLDDPGARSLVWAYFHEVPGADIYIGGASPEKAPLRIAVTTPQGALNDMTRKSLVEEVGRIVDDIVGPFEGRLNHWLMLYELRDGGWAGGGQVFRLPDIQAAMSIKAA